MSELKSKVRRVQRLLEGCAAQTDRLTPEMSERLACAQRLLGEIAAESSFRGCFDPFAAFDASEDAC